MSNITMHIMFYNMSTLLPTVKLCWYFQHILHMSVVKRVIWYVHKHRYTSNSNTFFTNWITTLMYKAIKCYHIFTCTLSVCTGHQLPARRLQNVELSLLDILLCHPSETVKAQYVFIFCSYIHIVIFIYFYFVNEACTDSGGTHINL